MHNSVAPRQDDNKDHRTIKMHDLQAPYVLICPLAGVNDQKMLIDVRERTKPPQLHEGTVIDHDHSVSDDHFAFAFLLG